MSCKVPCFCCRNFTQRVTDLSNINITTNLKCCWQWITWRRWTPTSNTMLPATPIMPTVEWQLKRHLHQSPFGTYIIPSCVWWLICPLRWHLAVRCHVCSVLIKWHLRVMLISAVHRCVVLFPISCGVFFLWFVIIRTEAALFTSNYTKGWLMWFQRNPENGLWVGHQDLGQTSPSS